tara:strand:+ start:456 stop:1946 length:1491 start_codon:yes stop_codon:yes gene_type:complete
MIDINILLDHFETLKGERRAWESSRDDIKKYVCPSSERTRDVYASIPSHAAGILASNLQSLLVNPAAQWFSLDLPQIEEDEDTLSWCQLATHKLNAAFSCRSTNFYSQIHEFFLTLVTYGSAIFYVEEDPKLPFCSFFRNIPLEECYFEENRFGFVDSIYRQFKVSLRVAATIWSDNAKIKSRAEKTPDEKITILHVVSPQIDVKKTSYQSLYILLEDKEILNESQYSYFPFMVTRWVKHEGAAYGYSPAHHVMPDIKLLNEYRKLGIKIKQKQVNPALLIPRQGYFLPLNTAPGQINFYENAVADKIIPLSNLENIEPTLDEQERCEMAIRAAFFMDVFHLPKENKEMTASEVNVRSEEQMRMMSPIVGRIEAELLDPLIHNVFNILKKYKYIDFGGVSNLEIEAHYISPLSRVQRLESTRSMENVLRFVANSGAANFSPEVYDNFNWDEVLKLYANLHNCPQVIFKEEGEVLRIRRLRQEQQQMQMQSQMAREG